MLPADQRQVIELRLSGLPSTEVAVILNRSPEAVRALQLRAAVDELGRVYVVDTGNNRLQVFTSDGRFLAQIGGLGTEPGQFREPNGVAVDEAARSTSVPSIVSRRFVSFIPAA